MRVGGAKDAETVCCELVAAARVLSLMIIRNFVEGSTPLLFVHSALGTNREMHALADAFPDRTTILVDLPMHGKEFAWDGPYAPETLGLWLLHKIAAMTATVIPNGQLDVVGYSMGGYVALSAAMQEHPLEVKRIRSVIAHAMKFFWSPDAVSTALSGIDHEALKRSSPKFVEALDRAHAAGARQVLSCVGQFMHCLPSASMTEDVLASLSIPVLLSTGTLDTMVTPDEVLGLWDGLDKRGKLNAQVSLFDDVQHPIKTLNPDRFTDAVLAFLTAVKDSAGQRQNETI